MSYKKQISAAREAMSEHAIADGAVPAFKRRCVGCGEPIPDSERIKPHEDREPFCNACTAEGV